MRILRRRGYRLTSCVSKSRAAGPVLPNAAMTSRVAVGGGRHVCSAQPLARRYLAELPQGRKAARVSELCRVREGSFTARGRSAPGRSGVSGRRRPRLPQADDVALGVGEVGRPAHVAGGELLGHRRAAQLGDACQCGVDVVDVDRDDGVRLVLVALVHPAVDRARLCRAACLVLRAGRQECVVQLGHRPDLPAERLAVEGIRPLGVVCRDLEVNDLVAHRASLTARPTGPLRPLNVTLARGADKCASARSGARRRPPSGVDGSCGPISVSPPGGRVVSVDAPLALYRRYRPDTFAEVIGQDHVAEPLSHALDGNRVNHAYLFSGPRGCGKTTCARIMARALNCEKGPTSTPCGVCESCVELARGGPGSIDVLEIDAASHGGVDDARDLRERAMFAPVRSRYKVYIIDEAHMVTTQGFNALLKLVEEPPAHLRFIFATTEPDKVIGTIRSRTHHYPFRLVPPKILGDYLVDLCGRERVAIEPTVVPLVVRAGAGS